MVVKGRSNTEIAKELFISVHTSKAHVSNILQKLCVDDRVQAAVKAVTENSDALNVKKDINLKIQEQLLINHFFLIK